MLSPDVEIMYAGYKFSNGNVKKLVEYYTEIHKAMQEQIDYYDERDADFSLAIKLHDKLPKKCKKFADELADYCLDWKYSDQDIVDLCEELIEEMKQ